jgi:hypothetical protein
MAGGILWFTHLSMKSINVYKYPIGKLRVQPVGIIIFAAVMATLGMLAFSPNGKWLSNLFSRTCYITYFIKQNKGVLLNTNWTYGNPKITENRTPHPYDTHTRL